jgi:hypothetical protein
LRDFPIYNEIRVAEFLPTPDVLLEVETIAHIPEKRR